MPAALSLSDIRRAWDTRDPQLIALLERLCTQPDPQPDTPPREGAPTFQQFLQTIRSYPFLRKTEEEQRHYRVEQMKALEAPTAEVPLPDRLRAHEVIYSLWESTDPLARDYLLRVIAAVPLVYGPWRAIKRIFKESEAKRDTEIYGAIAARLDREFAGRRGQVGGATIAYCTRRAWRFLRRTAVQLPATYADVACDFLVQYTDDTNLRGTWVANHIFFHDAKKYGRNSFRWGWREQPDAGNLKHRAYGDLWKRSPRPLFSLLERAKADFVRDFATSALKTDFRAVLREIEPGWVVRLVAVPSRAIHDFVVWILKNVPKFEQASFRTLGLHDAVLRLFDSPADTARVYAADYARTHARDLPVPELVRLANNDNEAVRKLARDLLGEKDARTEVGLEAWGQLLETEHGHKFAADVLTKSFGPKELTPDWFAGRLLSHSEEAFEFATKQLPKVHQLKDLGPAYFVTLLRKLDPEDDEVSDRAARFATEQIAKFDPNTLPVEDLRWMALFPPAENAGGPGNWIHQGKLKPQALGMDFLKMMAFQPDWDSSAWLADFKAKNGQWAKDLAFDDSRAAVVLSWFADVRKFTSAELGFEWLMRVVARAEPMYHDFARDRMIRSFTPADFAPQSGTSPPVATAGPSAADLKKASFLFTGKLASMTRDEAEGKVKDANGAVAGSVTNKLHYLVIGDEGSPLYGQGKKGSKQVKAEQLNAAGSNIAIISETMFLQMLAGGAAPAPADGDKAAAGCERLWAFVTAPGPADAPVGKFAREYFRKHHPDICQKLTERPVDPGAEIPAAFLTFDRVRPLLAETRRPLREFALELAEWEFARWNPSADQLVGVAEIPFVDVRRFVAKALLADDTPPNRRFRIDPAKLDANSVYRFCESNDDETRSLGMELIQRLPKLRVPEELFRLTESPDRRVRAFVIRTLWQVYRERGVTDDWKPPVPPKPTVGAKAKKAAEKAEANLGDGVPHRPEQWPAGKPTLAAFLRRVLFELPPGPPEKSKDAVDDSEPDAADKGPKKVVSTKSRPARRAKLESVDVMRDLALGDREFAAGILPLLDEFMLSRGVSERAACLVAVTRIRHTHAGV